jgi:adenosylcobinamide hydrolase
MQDPRDFVSAFSVERSTLIIRFTQPRRVLSSAVLGGGVGLCEYVLNHQLPPGLPAESWVFENPAAYLRTVARGLGLTGYGVGLMTAVSMDRLVCRRAQSRDLWVEAFITVGTSNAVRAGDPATAKRSGPPGTVNIILVTNARLATPAMVEAVQVATEAKAAAFAELKVISKVTGTTATGTGTDAIVIVSGHERRVQYAGTHTRSGEMVGRVVLEGVGEGLRRRAW